MPKPPKPDPEVPEFATGGVLPATRPATVAAGEIVWSSPRLTDAPRSGYVGDSLVWIPGRWVDTQAVFNHDQGLIRYGDPFWCSQEQVDQDPRIISWSDSFTPDTDRVAVSLQEG